MSKASMWNLLRPRLLSLRVALFLIVSIHILAAFLLLRLEINNAPEVYVPHDAPAAQLERSLRAEFPNDENLIALFGGPDIYSDSFLTALHRVAQRLEQHPLVDRVFSVTTIDHIAGTEDGFTVEKL
ncbi:MAG: RND transporter, partial [Gammaproteobacteria bacterium]|nr:RND transporter [Gammaproteobacteria bacterium]